MASEVDISNLALAHLGDNATVASLDPPEGSAQAEHCARFYPIARNALLELHPWNFASKRVALAALTNTWLQWDYAYAKPSDCLKIYSLFDINDTEDRISTIDTLTGNIATTPYIVEADYTTGAEIILTDLADAALRYTSLITDTTKFSPLFILALSHYLAAMLAGPILKGDAGKAEAKAQMGIMAGYLAQAQMSDTNQRKLPVTHNVAWMANR